MGNFSLSDMKREVHLPEINSNELSEFFGILTGDGYMNLYRKYDYVIEISGNKLSDKDYHKVYLTNLIKQLFNVIPSSIERKNENSICTRIRSKAVFNYLLNKGFKKGKKGFIGIPLWIKDNDESMKSFIKGLFDTDGCLSLKNKEGKKYPVVSITSKSKKLLLHIKDFIKLRGISSCLIRYEDYGPKSDKKSIRHKLEINGNKNLNLWFDLVGSSNSRNRKKYCMAKELQKLKTKV